MIWAESLGRGSRRGQVMNPGYWYAHSHETGVGENATSGWYSISNRSSVTVTRRTKALEVPLARMLR